MDSIPAPGPHHEHKPHKSMVLGSHLEFRDEQIYLRSIAPHVHLSRSPGNEKGGEVVNIQWGRVLWITTKDHVLTPLIRGLVWGIAGQYVGLITAAVMGRNSASQPLKKQNDEGRGVNWLRKTLLGFMSGIKASVASPSRV